MIWVDEIKVNPRETKSLRHRSIHSGHKNTRIPNPEATNRVQNEKKE